MAKHATSEQPHGPAGDPVGPRPIDYTKLPPVQRIGPSDCSNCGRTAKLKYGLCKDCHEPYSRAPHE